MGRAPCCDKTAVKKGPWSPEEDAVLKSYIEKHGTGNNWIALPHKIGIKRCGKSCRLRWLNYLRPNLKHGGFTDEEDYIICSLFITIGSRWSIIASQLPGRTDNDIKNYWNTRLKKKLLNKQNVFEFNHETTTTSGQNQTLHNHMVDPPFAIEEQSMIKNSTFEMLSFEPNKSLFDIDHYHHHHSSPSLNSMCSSNSNDTNYSSLQMSHYNINNNDHGDHDLFMTGFENLFDNINNNNNIQETGFCGTDEMTNNKCLDHDISSFIDYPLYDNE